jgi:hypothetical protein
VITIEDVIAESAVAYREFKSIEHRPLAASTLLRRAIDADQRLQDTVEDEAGASEVELFALGRSFMIAMWAQLTGVDSDQAEAEFKFQAYGYVD